MEKILTEICEEINNYFWRTKRNVKLTISGGTFTVDFLQEGQYFRIKNSIFNEGVHKYPATDLTDEKFEGEIWSMAVPQAVIDLASDGIKLCVHITGRQTLAYGMTSVHFPDVRLAVDLTTEMRLGTIDGDTTEDRIGSFLFHPN